MQWLSSAQTTVDSSWFPIVYILCGFGMILLLYYIIVPYLERKDKDGFHDEEE
jgi:hypothetical protein